MSDDKKNRGLTFDMIYDEVRELNTKVDALQNVAVTHWCVACGMFGMLFGASSLGRDLGRMIFYYFGFEV
jgi:hypothetical protein